MKNIILTSIFILISFSCWANNTYYIGYLKQFPYIINWTEDELRDQYFEIIKNIQNRLNNQKDIELIEKDLNDLIKISLEYTWFEGEVSNDFLIKCEKFSKSLKNET